jgi:NAD(P)-dependent dehydrogenase (short-subunit alcohol dehydrogenase family)
MMHNSFAIITGSTSGIGQAIAIELARQGAQVLLTGRNKEKLEQTATLIKNAGGLAESFACDLADQESLDALIKHVRQQTKQVDILVNVAGIWHGENEVYAGKDFETFSPTVVQSTLAVGIIAPTMLSHAFIPLMKAGSKILNISGTFENGAKGWLPYYVSKKAIEDLTIGLAEEVREKQICVNAISPSDTSTPAYGKYFPQYMDDAIKPEAIADFAAQLCSPNSTITGKIFVMKKDHEPYEGYHT